MQAINPPTEAQLLAKGQQMLVKFEIYVSPSWINLCSLDGKNYLEDWSISLGGAGMTPAPIGGSFSISLSNENNIFHPNHPTSAYKDYIKTGRKARLLIGARYDPTDYYWQRIIGFMDEPKFDVTGQKISISCLDYMKLLEDTELRTPNNYWGASQIFSSFSSDGKAGTEKYNEMDAMDINNEAENVDNWTPTDCTFAVEEDAGGGSVYVGKAACSASVGQVKNNNIFTPEANKEYLFQYKYKKVSGDGNMGVSIYQYIGDQYVLLAAMSGFDATNYTELKLYFTAQTTAAIQIWLEFHCPGAESEFRVDQFSIYKFIPYEERYYELPEACKGPYRVILDDVDVWQGEEDEGWHYEESTRRLSFDINKTVASGMNNLDIYYFTTQPLENVIADILVIAGLYDNQLEAFLDMLYTDPAIDIDQVWFDAGTSALEAIRIICERCDYRFHFSYAGKPVFKPKPSPGSTAFAFTSQAHVASVSNYQDRGEIWNRIIIEGKEQAEPVNPEETLPSKLRGEDYNQTSINNFGERTKTIKNHLFQTQVSIDAMVTSLLNQFKDPKLYADFEASLNPVPLELGDRVSWKERLSPSLEISQLGIIRDIKIDKWNPRYICEIV
jgi:hypothetical protein